MHEFEPHSPKHQIAAAAATMVVEEGLEYGPAKRRAVKQLGLPARTALPDNDLVESAVRDYIALFCADTQPAELAALRAEKDRQIEELNAEKERLQSQIEQLQNVRKQSCIRCTVF